MLFATLKATVNCGLVASGGACMCSIVAQVQIFSVWPADIMYTLEVGKSKVGSRSLFWKSRMAAAMTKIQLQPKAGFQLIEMGEWMDKPLGPVRHGLVIFMQGHLTDFHERER